MGREPPVENNVQQRLLQDDLRGGNVQRRRGVGSRVRFLVLFQYGIERRRLALRRGAFPYQHARDAALFAGVIGGVRGYGYDKRENKGCREGDEGSMHGVLCR